MSVANAPPDFPDLAVLGMCQISIKAHNMTEDGCGPREQQEPRPIVQSAVDVFTGKLGV